MIDAAGPGLLKLSAFTPKKSKKRFNKEIDIAVHSAKDLAWICRPDLKIELSASAKIRAMLVARRKKS